LLIATIYTWRAWVLDKVGNGPAWRRISCFRRASRSKIQRAQVTERGHRGALVSEAKTELPPSKRRLW